MTALRARPGFTLIEMIVVLAIVAILLGVVVATPKGDEREGPVRAAAHELAATLRQARTMAMETHGMYAVTFNIQNPVGFSGRVISNAGGGHWYRILGPRQGVTVNAQQCGVMPGAGFPPFYSRDYLSLNGSYIGWSASNTDSPLRHHFEAVEKAWAGDRRTLPRGKARFVALTDQDDGNFRVMGDTYPPTYPRPWFGWWDAASKRLYPWGGYDPALAMTAQTGADYASIRPARTLAGRTISHSGFFYEGYDGVITGCKQPSDRLICDDTNDDGALTTADSATPTYPLWRKDDPRPLINGNWQDYMIVFRPDGTAWTDWMRLRHEAVRNFDRSGNLVYDPSLYNSAVVLTVPAGKRHLVQLGPGDMCNFMSGADWYKYGPSIEATSVPTRSGFSYVTLGPDVNADNDVFPTAEAARLALMPLYRVGVSPFGEVTVVRVGSSKPAGKDYDTALTGSDWNVKAKTDAYYPYRMLMNTAAGAWEWRGSPVTDVVTAEMLAQRMWWWR